MAMRGPRHPIGAAPWIAEERTTALQIARTEVDEFSFSAKNEMDWLNEHMADIFSENQISVADIFKTPGKLRGKTPRTIRKTNKGDIRAPLTDVFSATPKGLSKPLSQPQFGQQQPRNAPSFRIAKDRSSKSPRASLSRPAEASKTKTSKTAKAGKSSQKPTQAAPAPSAPPAPLTDSGYHGSFDEQAEDENDENQRPAPAEEDDDVDDLAMSAAKPAAKPHKPVAAAKPARPAKTTKSKSVATKAAAPEPAPDMATPTPAAHPAAALHLPGAEHASSSPSQPGTERSSFHSAKEEQTATAALAPYAITSPPLAAEASSPVASVLSPSPVRPKRASPPRRKPVPQPQQKQQPQQQQQPPQPSSPLQSFTPACPPPPELLAAMGHAAPAAVASPIPAHMHVPPAVPTPPVARPEEEEEDEPVAILDTEMTDEEPDAEPTVDHIEVHEDARDDPDEDGRENHEDNEAQSAEASPSERPVVRKSSLNFASLPAREPFTSNKSMGGAARMSRTSHVDPSRTSYYNRMTSGKSLGNALSADEDEEEEDRERPREMQDVDTDDDFVAQNNKTYTQRLQDRISMLGKSQANGPRPSKSLASHLPATAAQNSKDALSALAQKQLPSHSQQSQQSQQSQPVTSSSTPKRRERLVGSPAPTTPGAFPEEEEEEDDDWILPPPDTTITSPRLKMPKNAAFAASVAETTANSLSEHVLPKQRQDASSRPASPVRTAPMPLVPERMVNAAGHAKSSSVPSLPVLDGDMALAKKKTAVSVSNPTSVPAHELVSSPAKSPSRTLRDSPLRHVKSKLSSIIKSSRGLLASSAALSAEGKSSILTSPSSLRLGMQHTTALMEASGLKMASSQGSTPNLSNLPNLFAPSPDLQTVSVDHEPEQSVPERGSPVRQNSRRTRASSERERREQKQREKEQKEAHREKEQMEKLERMREREREKARVFSEEKERMAAMEKQMKEREQREREQREREQREREQRERERLERERLERERQEREQQEREQQEREQQEREQQEREQQEREQQEREQQEREQRERQRQEKEEREREMEKWKEQQSQVAEEEMDFEEQPAKTASPSRVPTRATRTSPRKTKTTASQPDAADTDMADAPTTRSAAAAASATPAPAASSAVPRSATQTTRSIRRPLKPTKETAKTKQAPTVIRVNTTSTQQHQQHQQSQQSQQQQSQFHPSNSVLASTLHETLMGPQHSQHAPPQLKTKASTASLHTKPSLQSLKSSVSSSGRPRALEVAARRKEQEEREAQRKRDAKAEMERKRAALAEQEEQRRQEQQQKREREAEAARKAAAQQQRQAAIEKAKQTRAPPPAQRTQLPTGAPDFGRGEQQPPRSQSRLATAAAASAAPAAPAATPMTRSQEELHRPVNVVLSNAGKSQSKRALPGGLPDHSGRSMAAGGAGNSSTMPAYQAKDAKRIRMSEEFDEDEMEVGGHMPRGSSIKGPPVRPSGGFKKDLPNKSVFGNGYATVPGSTATNATRDLFKTAMTSQHGQQLRAGHPLDMAQVSKAAIPFAPSAGAASAASAASTSTASSNAHKTPVRPVGVPLTAKSTVKSVVSKSAAGKAAAAAAAASAAGRSSPRVPNGDGIELPEIQTDDEDSEDEGQVNVAPWADSPDLRRALMQQETMDPMQVFGPPRPLNMEEVFSKSKDRWSKFRARTSSANWSGADRLTEEDIRKDLAARDRIRREGGWTYELNRDMNN